MDGIESALYIVFARRFRCCHSSLDAVAVIWLTPTMLRDGSTATGQGPGQSRPEKPTSQRANRTTDRTRRAEEPPGRKKQEKRQAKKQLMDIPNSTRHTLQDRIVSGAELGIDYRTAHPRASRSSSPSCGPDHGIWHRMAQHGAAWHSMAEVGEIGGSVDDTALWAVVGVR